MKHTTVEKIAMFLKVFKTKCDTLKVFSTNALLKEFRLGRGIVGIMVKKGIVTKERMPDNGYKWTWVSATEPNLVMAKAILEENTIILHTYINKAKTEPIVETVVSEEKERGITIVNTPNIANDSELVSRNVSDNTLEKTKHFLEILKKYCDGKEVFSIHKIIRGLKLGSVLPTIMVKNGILERGEKCGKSYCWSWISSEQPSYELAKLILQKGSEYNCSYAVPSRKQSESLLSKSTIIDNEENCPIDIEKAKSHGKAIEKVTIFLSKLKKLCDSGESFSIYRLIKQFKVSRNFPTFLLKNDILSKEKFGDRNSHKWTWISKDEPNEAMADKLLNEISVACTNYRNIKLGKLSRTVVHDNISKTTELNKGIFVPSDAYGEEKKIIHENTISIELIKEIIGYGLQKERAFNETQFALFDKLIQDIRTDIDNDKKQLIEIVSKLNSTFEIFVMNQMETEKVINSRISFLENARKSQMECHKANKEAFLRELDIRYKKRPNWLVRLYRWFPKPKLSFTHSF